MNAGGCDKDALALHAFESLTSAERDRVDLHIARCRDCATELSKLEEAHRMLARVPPEALLHGPPPGGTQLLERTLRSMRAELAAGRRRRGLTRGAVSLAACLALFGSFQIGALAAPQTLATVSPSPAPVVPGTRIGTVEDPTTHVRLAATVIPAGDWVRVRVDASGIPAGELCRVIVVSRNGRQEVAGSWFVSADPNWARFPLDGAAAVAPGDVAAVELEGMSGKVLASLAV